MSRMVARKEEEEDRLLLWGSEGAGKFQLLAPRLAVGQMAVGGDKSSSV